MFTTDAVATGLSGSMTAAGIMAYQLAYHPSVVGHNERTVRNLWVLWVLWVSFSKTLPFLTTFQTCSEIVVAKFQVHLSDLFGWL